MKILCITSSEEDYLGDSILIGLRNLLGADCVDYPRKDILYRTCPDSARKRVRGNGFTLYDGCLEDFEIDRSHIVQRIRNREFDLILFSSIWRQYGLFAQLLPWFGDTAVAVLDGEDTDQVYPAAGLWWRRPYYWFLPRAHSRYPYFKREWTENSRFSTFHRLVPKSFRSPLPFHSSLRPISFGIPACKVVPEIPAKTKQMVTHVVDPEVAKHFTGSNVSYAFADEAAYYRDLQTSIFGVTTKRSGWDCLRHYELAANACIPCFKNLSAKPATCAPHGLDAGNCLQYQTPEELIQKMNGLQPNQIHTLQQNILTWARQHTCEAIAGRLLGELIDRG